MLDELKALLEKAIADIPHVGRFCKFRTEKGYCSKDGSYCCNQAHTPCDHWEWRGNDEKIGC